MHEGSHPVPPQDLVAEAASLARIAAALVQSSHDRDDLVQETYRAALERPPRARADRGELRGWLAVVARRLFQRSRRDARLRAWNEARAARPEAVQPDEEETDERLRLARIVVEELASVPEPYRSTVRLHYFDGLTLREIAERQGVSHEAARQRASRGIARLRERVERAAGRSWMAALIPLARGPRPLAVSGGLVMSTVVKFGIGVAAAAAIAWMIWPRAQLEPASAPARGDAAALLEPARAPDPDAARRSERSAVEISTRADETPESRPQPPPSAEPTEEECAAMEQEVPATTLRGLVLRGREPVRGGRVLLGTGNVVFPRDLLDGGPTAWWKSATTAPIGPDGRFSFDDLRPDWYTLAVDVGSGTCRQMGFNLNRGDSPARSIVIVLGSAAVVGHVHDAEGRPAAGARVIAEMSVVRNDEGRQFQTTCITDAGGGYELRELAAGSYLLGVRLDGDTLDPNLDETRSGVAVPLGGRVTVDFGRSVALPFWTGVVRVKTGDLVQGAGKIMLEEESTKRRTEGSYDETGSFRIALMPGTYDVHLPSNGQHPFRTHALGTITVTERGLEHDLVLPGARVRGVAIDARTGAAWERSLIEYVYVVPKDLNYPAHYGARVAAEGRFVLDGLEPGEWIATGWPVHVAGPTDASIHFTVAEGDVEIPLSVTIGPR